MALTSAVSGTVTNDTILRIEILRDPSTGDLTCNVDYDIGGGKSKRTTWVATAGDKANIENTYTTIKAAITSAEGL